MRICLILLLSSAAACDRGPTIEGHEAALSDSPRRMEDPEPGSVVAEVEWPHRGAAAQARPADFDGDGFAVDVDPDDEKPFVFPGAEEVPCNGVDEDGDGVDACPPDVDGDGVRADRDCDDLNPNIRPLLPDIPCNGIDENCNGYDDCDRDGDGFLDHDDLDPDDPDVNAVIDENPTEQEP